MSFIYILFSNITDAHLISKHEDQILTMRIKNERYDLSEKMTSGVLLKIINCSGVLKLTGNTRKKHFVTNKPE